MLKIHTDLEFLKKICMFFFKTCEINLTLPYENFLPESKTNHLL
jgi:hypothetical protein